MRCWPPRRSGQASRPRQKRRRGRRVVALVHVPDEPPRRLDPHRVQPVLFGGDVGVALAWRGMRPPVLAERVVGKKVLCVAAAPAPIKIRKRFARSAIRRVIEWGTTSISTAKAPASFNGEGLPRLIPADQVFFVDAVGGAGVDPGHVAVLIPRRQGASCPARRGGNPCGRPWRWAAGRGENIDGYLSKSQAPSGQLGVAGNSRLVVTDASWRRGATWRKQRIALAD